MSRMRNGPVQIAVLMLALLAGCRREEAGSGDAAPAGGPVQTDTLTGLYESGGGARRNQLCMIEKEGRSTTFGFVTWSSGDANCSGSGIARRDGDRLRLELDGDESCTLDAALDGRRVTLPASIPPQCQRYYCGPGAQMAGMQFDKVGGAETDAMRAKDLVGDPLCGG